MKNGKSFHLFVVDSFPFSFLSFSPPCNQVEVFVDDIYGYFPWYFLVHSSSHNKRFSIYLVSLIHLKFFQHNDDDGDDEEKKFKLQFKTRTLLEKKKKEMSFHFDNVKQLKSWIFKLKLRKPKNKREREVQANYFHIHSI